MNIYTGTLLLISSVLAGGAIVAFLQKMNQERIIKVLLALSGGFLLAIAFVHFIPEIYEHHSEKVGYYILLGFLIQLFLEYFSGGIEHGHIHDHHIKGSVPWSLFIALSIHAIFEAIPLEATFGGHLPMDDGHNHGLSVSNSLLVGIVLHKMPVAIALMTLLLASGFKKSKAWLVLVAFSLMSPLGMVIGHFGAKNIGLDLEMALAVVVGMFLHISTTIVFEASDHHKFNYIKLISILGGVGLGLLAI